MPTRVKRPSILVKLAITASLVAFQGYLGYHVLTGAFGIESQKEMLEQIEVLKAQRASLQAELDSYRQRIALFDTARLDPDIVTERARAYLGLVRPDDILILDEPSRN